MPTPCAIHHRPTQRGGAAAPIPSPFVYLLPLFTAPTVRGSRRRAQAIKVANPDATEDTIKMLLSHADEDGDGNIDFEEYCKIMRHVDD